MMCLMIEPVNIPVFHRVARTGNKPGGIHVFSNMTHRLLLLGFLLLPVLASSQIGINYKYIIGKSDFLSANGISQDGHQYLVEYNFRLKQKRLEFRPGAGYRYTFGGNLRVGHFNAYDLDLGVAIYPFDFAGDCHCPTFSKEGKLFKKGFFLEVIPGVSLQKFTRTEIEPNSSVPIPIEDQQMIWKIGGALGLDIGISDMITITPMVSLVKLGSADYEGLLSDGGAAKLEDYSYLAPGIRLTYHPDEKRRRRF